MKKHSAYAFLILMVMLAAVAPTILLAHAQTRRVVEVTAQQFQFVPARIVVNQGDVVTFKVKSTDVTHGFYIDGYGVETLVSPGQEVTITIVADKLGKFKIRCSVTCGPLHPFMVGELVVEQGGLNYAFLSSVSAILAIGAATMAVAWRRE